MTQVQLYTTLHRKIPAHYKVMPWASGKGSTTELYVFPKKGKITDGSAIWRVSMARVTENGPFSPLPDYERIIAIAKGEGFRLTGNMGADVEVVSGVIHAFSGREAINCTLLGGPCLDLNIMYKRDKVQASLALLGQAKPMHAVISLQSSKETIIVICLEGRATVQTYGKPVRCLSPQDSVAFSSKEGKASLAVETQAGARAALVAIETF